MPSEIVAPAQLEALVGPIRQAVPSVVAAYVFGSVASNTAGPHSDVDIAILAAVPLTPEARYDLAQSLALLLGRDVDVVDLRRASTVLRVQVLGSARLLLDSEPTQRAEFEAVALGAYARLNEERRGIIADIRARGSVYG